MNGRWRVLLSGSVVLVTALAALGQEAVPSPYFDCPYVNYFDSECPQLRKLWEEQEQRLQRQEDAPEAPRGQEPEVPAMTVKDQEAVPSGPDSSETYLLFPKESLAPDAPPLFRRLLAEPTIENARRYVRWYSRRAARLQAVQALIRLAGSEVESDDR